jgi:hypothetical protein
MDDRVNGRLAWMCMGMSALCVIKAQSKLAMDAFHGHLSDRTRSRFRNKNTDLMIIPSDMISQLQPLNVSVNKPFKHLVCKHRDAWLNKDNCILTPSGKIKSVSVNNGVDVKSLEISASLYYSKIVFKVLFVLC